jgi:hypothetical protein
LGRWVSTDAAAVFAILSPLGSRKTFEAAVAAGLLVTSPFEPCFGIWRLPIQTLITIDERR